MWWRHEEGVCESIMIGKLGGRPEHLAEALRRGDVWEEVQADGRKAYFHRNYTRAPYV